MKDIIEIKNKLENIESKDNLLSDKDIKNIFNRLNNIFPDYVSYIDSFSENDLIEYKSCYEWSKTIKNFKFTIGIAFSNYEGSIIFSIDFVNDNGEILKNLVYKKEEFSNTFSNLSFTVENFIKLYKNKKKILKFFLK